MGVDKEDAGMTFVSDNKQAVGCLRLVWVDLPLNSHSHAGVEVVMVVAATSESDAHIE